MYFWKIICIVLILNEMRIAEKSMCVWEKEREGWFGNFICKNMKLKDIFAERPKL